MKENTLQLLQVRICYISNKKLLNITIGDYKKTKLIINTYNR